MGLRALIVVIFSSFLLQACGASLFTDQKAQPIIVTDNFENDNIRTLPDLDTILINILPRQSTILGGSHAS